MKDVWNTAAARMLANRMVIAILSAVSGGLFAAFPLHMTSLCGGG